MNNLIVHKESFFAPQQLKLRQTKCAPRKNTYGLVEVICDVNIDKQYSSICNEYQSHTKWLVFVNAHRNLLSRVVKENDGLHAKVLNVDASKSLVKIEHIVQSLQQGHCKVIVLCDPKLTSSDKKKLEQSAELGGCMCIILKTASAIH